MNTFNDSTVRWGVLGVGDVCEVKSAPAMDKIDKSELVAVMRRSADKAKDYAKRHNVPKWYDDADRLLNDPDVNTIYIATPPNAHAELTQKALTTGKPVYVEKPMARTFDECQKMLKVANEKKLPLYVAYYRRALPNFLKIKQLIKEGAIGKVRTVNIRLHKSIKPDIIAENEENWRVNPEVAGGGYFYDLASHQLDFLDFILGPITEANGFSANQAGLYEANDIVNGSFKFKNGVLGSGSWCFTVSDVSSIDKTIITGDKGQISYPTFDDSYVELDTDEPRQKIYQFEMPKHIQQPLIQSVVDNLLRDGSCESTGTSAARTNRVMQKLTESVRCR